MNMANITFEVPGLSSFIFEKYSQKNAFAIKYSDQSFKGFDWNNVGPASQTVAQHYISNGPMYRVVWCFGRRDGKYHPHTNTAVRNVV